MRILMLVFTIYGVHAGSFESNIFARKLVPCASEGQAKSKTCRPGLAVCAIVDKSLAELIGAKKKIRIGGKKCIKATTWLLAKKQFDEPKVDLKATSITALEMTSKFKSKWQHRVIECSVKTYAKQVAIFNKRPELVKDLKLIVIPQKNLKNGCKLIGLDGGTAARRRRNFSLLALENLINAMPMRRAELDARKSGPTGP